MTTALRFLFSQCNILVEPLLLEKDFIAVYVQSSGDGGEIDPNAKIGKKMSRFKILPIEVNCIRLLLYICA